MGLLEVARLWAAWRKDPLPGFHLQLIGWPVRLNKDAMQQRGAASISACLRPSMPCAVIRLPHVVRLQTGGSEVG